MSDAKISALTGATTPLAGTETLPVVQSTTTKNVSVANLTVGRDVSAAGVSVSAGTGVEGSMTRNATNGLSFRGVSGTSTNELVWLNSSGSPVCYVPNGTTNLTVASTIAATTGTFGQLTGTVVRNGTPSEGSITSDATNGLIVRGLSGASTNEFELRGSSGVTALRVPTGTVNVGFGGNLIQGTAAKGINFTANTPAAGMTSQLLNWYEEGTWTPTVAPGSGSITAYTATGYYTRIGRQVTLLTTVVITTVGTGTGALTISSLPFAISNSMVNGAGRENAVAGYSTAITYGSTSSFFVNAFDNRNMVAAGSSNSFVATYFI